MPQNGNKGEIVIYKPKRGLADIKVRLEQETVWLNQTQMCELFDKNKRTVSEHVRNIFKDKELREKSVVRNFRTTAADGKAYNVIYYNLDVIISVGYRVKSKRGTQFRIWATQILKDYIVKGFSINEKRLREENALLVDLRKATNFMGRLLNRKELDSKESSGLLKVITDYSYALTILDQYDHQELKIRKTTRKREFKINYDLAMAAVVQLEQEFKQKNAPVGLFGKEKDKSFRSSLGAIYQTFGKKELYPSIEEKASHLLYFVVKNHSFVDGNKRIAA